MEFVQRKKGESAKRKYIPAIPNKLEGNAVDSDKVDEYGERLKERQYTQIYLNPRPLSLTAECFKGQQVKKYDNGMGVSVVFHPIAEGWEGTSSSDFDESISKESYTNILKEATADTGVSRVLSKAYEGQEYGTAFDEVLFYDAHNYLVSQSQKNNLPCTPFIIERKLVRSPLAVWNSEEEAGKSKVYALTKLAKKYSKDTWGDFDLTNINVACYSLFHQMATTFIKLATESDAHSKHYGHQVDFLKKELEALGFYFSVDQNGQTHVRPEAKDVVSASLVCLYGLTHQVAATRPKNADKTTRYTKQEAISVHNAESLWQFASVEYVSRYDSARKTQVNVILADDVERLSYLLSKPVALPLKTHMSGLYLPCSPAVTPSELAQYYIDQKFIKPDAKAFNVSPATSAVAPATPFGGGVAPSWMAPNRPTAAPSAVASVTATPAPVTTPSVAPSVAPTPVVAPAPTQPLSGSAPTMPPAMSVSVSSEEDIPF